MGVNSRRPAILFSCSSTLIIGAWCCLLGLLEFPAACADGGDGHAQQPSAGGFQCCDNRTSLPFVCDSRYDKAVDCKEKDLIFISPSIYVEDNFTITEKGVLVVGENFPVSYTKYCVGWVHRRSNAEKGLPTEDHDSPAALVCIPELFPENEEQIVLVSVCLLVSSVFACLTLLVYCLLPQLRDLQGKTIMCMLISICFGYPTLGSMQLFASGDSACVLSAIVIFFWLLATFCWLNLSSFNIWRSVVLADRRYKDSTLFMAYSLFGWGIPLLFLLAVITFEYVIDHDIKPNFGLSRCWFHREKETWIFFYGPIAIFLMANIFFFLSTVYHLWNVYSTDTSMSESRLKKMKYKCKLYCRLFLTMGITFIFEILSFAFEQHVSDSWRTWWDIMDIINSLQGVILFVILVLTRKKVLRGLSTVSICGYKICCVKSAWDNFEDEESDNERDSQADNIQLGNENQ